MSARILVVDDEPQIRRVMRATLTAQGYTVSDARSGEEALEKLGQSPQDLVLLDVNMPGLGGLAACRAIRAGFDVSIIMLTVRNAEKDKVEALDAGADDYVTKPFGTPELLARIRAALRRSASIAPAGAQPMTIGEFMIDFQGRQVVIGERHTRLTPKEFDLLWHFVTHANRTITHRDLLQAVWGLEYGGEVEYLRVFVNQLRKKIEPDPANPKYLLTKPWVGYRFQLPGQR
ncbi:MAG TPA: response regulator transcription factor [Bryobacteraceae bacterium]|nr:response regulator transcription factor [Bryobacteraceae bacterium]